MLKDIALCGLTSVVETADLTLEDYAALLFALWTTTLIGFMKNLEVK